MNNENTSLLQQYIDKLNNIKMLNCELAHEKVMLDQSKQPLKYKVGDIYYYQRPGICAKAKREHLGCAHTSARGKLIYETQLIAKHYPETLSITQEFINQLNQLEHEIVLIDRQKNDSEEILAKAFEIQQIKPSLDSAEHITNIKQQIQSIVSQHNSLNHKLDNLLQSYKNALIKTQT